MKKKQYLAAVSGGPDSMSLLNKYKNQIKVVCSVDYNKRQNSHLDNEIVKNFCEQHHIDFCLLKVDDELYKQYGEYKNFQDQARRIRYDFFVKISEQYGINDLLIAHNKSDDYETAYYQLKRNSQALYYGIKKHSTYLNLKITRPLLKYHKQSLLQYCKQNNIPYAIDYTNDLDCYQRNINRKLINGWSKKQRIAFVFKIKKYNLMHTRINNKINKKFKQWSGCDFVIDYFLKQTNKQVQYHLIYKLLSKYNEVNISKDKVINCIDFLMSKSSKQYRLENNKYLMIKNHQVIIQC